MIELGALRHRLADVPEMAGTLRRFFAFSELRIN